MGWTEKDFITQAFNENGMSSYMYDITPDELTNCAIQLHAMIATWNGKGIRLGYPLPSSPSEININVDTKVPDIANEAIYSNLAIRIAPSYGKSVSHETKMKAKDSFSTLATKYSYAPPMQFPGTLPVGAGNKPWRGTLNPFMRPPVDGIALEKDHILKL